MKLFASKLFVVLALTLSATFSLAQQNYVFRVMATSGSAEIKKNNSWQPLRSGASLFVADEIKLGVNTYVGLVHSSGKSKELMVPGTFKISELAKGIGSGSSVMIKYFDFMLSKNSDEAKKNRLIAVGSATRTSFKEDILVQLPENRHADLLNSKVIIHWESKSDSLGPFIVSIQNMSNDELITIETKLASVAVDFNRPELSGDFNFLIEIRNKNNKSLKSDQYLIKRLQKDDQKKFNDEITIEMREETALNKIMLAGFFETNYLLIDAIAAYEEAIQLAPTVGFYREAYEEFLLRNRLKFPKQ